MYHQHFGLNRSPFSIEPDPGFLWLGEKHQEGLSVLRYALLENKGFMLLTGDVGTGKTVLIKRLLSDLTDDVTVATIPNPSLTPLDFYTILSHELGMASTVDGKGDFLIKFKKFVRSVCGSQKRLLVIIDEAQRLTNELLDEIRVLSNIDYENCEVVNIFFAGQIEFSQILAAPCNEALRQRITVSYHLVPLSQEETGAYIQHRLKVAGTEKELFMGEAVREIFLCTNGIPRLINILCDRALITGYTQDLKRIDPELIRECARELDFSYSVATPGTKSVQVEPPSALQEKGDQTKAFTKVSGTGRKWLPAAVAGCIACLIFWVFFSKAPEIEQAPLLARSQTVAISLPISADPKDASPVAIAMLPDGQHSKKSNEKMRDNYGSESSETVRKQNSGSEKPFELALPQRPEPLEKLAKQDFLDKFPPEQTAGIDRSVTEKSPPVSAEGESKRIVARERRFLLFFKANSVDLEDGSYETLRQVSTYLSANPNSEVVLFSQSTHDDRPGLGPKLLELRVTGVRSVLFAKPNFKGKINVISRPQRVGDNQELAGRRLIKPWMEVRVEPRAESQTVE
jgi:type II secretory pathway predicted ATPase ExeA